MLKFFRRIRRNLINEGRLHRYLLYAIGEILLVMIGILLALQVNNWNLSRIDVQNEKKYLKAISADLVMGLDIHQRAYLNRLDQKLEGLQLAKAYAEGNHSVRDTLSFLEKVSFGGVFSGGFQSGFRNTYEQLINSGNVELIRDADLKAKIHNYFVTQSSLMERSQVFKSDYAPYMNSLRPFDDRNPDVFSPFDREEILTTLQSAEFRRIVDGEISYAYSIRRYIVELDGMAEEIIQLIEEYVN